MNTTASSEILKDNVFLQTSKLFVEISEEERINELLDDILHVKSLFAEVFEAIDDYIAKAVVELNDEALSNKELSLRKEYILKHKQAVNKVLRTIKNAIPQFRMGIITESKALVVYRDDFEEILKDIEFKTSSPKKLNDILEEFAGFEDFPDDTV